MKELDIYIYIYTVMHTNVTCGFTHLFLQWTHDVIWFDKWGYIESPGDKKTITNIYITPANVIKSDYFIIN